MLYALVGILPVMLGVAVETRISWYCIFWFANIFGLYYILVIL